MTFAWDFSSNNCYAEWWVGDLTKYSANCFNQTVAYSEPTYRCSSARDTTNVGALYGAFFRTVNVTEGVVKDPFNPDPAAPQLVMWRNRAGSTWMWFDQTSGNLIYLVTPRPAEVTRSMAFQFVNGGGWSLASTNGFSSWWFVL